MNFSASVKQRGLEPNGQRLAPCRLEATMPNGPNKCKLKGKKMLGPVRKGAISAEIRLSQGSKKDCI
jgi:hypothetical protein